MATLLAAEAAALLLVVDSAAQCDYSICHRISDAAGSETAIYLLLLLHCWGTLLPVSLSLDDSLGSALL